MACITFLTRFIAIALLRNSKTSAKTLDVMRLVPIAVLASLISPALFAPRGSVDLSFTNEYLAAGLAAILVTYRTKALVLTIVVGIATILSMRFLVP